MLWYFLHALSFHALESWSKSVTLLNVTCPALISTKSILWMAWLNIIHYARVMYQLTVILIGKHRKMSPGEKKVTIVETMQLDCSSIPNEIRSIKNRKKNSTIFAYAKNDHLVVVSYTDKGRSGKKNVLVWKLLTLMYM